MPLIHGRMIAPMLLPEVWRLEAEPPSSDKSIANDVRILDPTELRHSNLGGPLTGERPID